MAVHPQCHIIGVIGGKGGVGKSIFAANLSFAFLLEMRQPTLLIDLDAQSAGDQNVITGLRPLKTISEVAQSTSAVTAQTLASLVTKHPSGLGYIGAVHRPDELLSVAPDLFTKQLEGLSQFFRFIIIDLGSQLTPLQMSVIHQASAVTVITVPEVLAINQTIRTLNDLIANALPGDLFQIIINKASAAGLSSQIVSQSLRRAILGQIPQDDVTVTSALQRSAPFVLNQPKVPISTAYHEVVRKLTGGILQKNKSLARPGAANVVLKSESQTPQAAAQQTRSVRGQKRELDPRTVLKMRCHTELLAAMDLKKGIADTQGDPNKERALHQKTAQVVSQTVDREAQGLPREERAKIVKEVVDEALGLGPLEVLLADPTVTEIMVNGCDQIYVEKIGKLTLSPVTFTSNLQLRNVIDRIVQPLGRRIDEKTPYVDARLTDGSRVNAVIEPLAIDGPAVTIRKFSKQSITPEKYIEWGSATKPMMDFLRICVENGLNVIISGGTGSGKTTLLNCLSGFIPASERIITVEDAAELQLKQEHVVRLETRPANMEGSGAITIRDLVRNALRMRPNRIVVGECRDGAALDMLSAMNTGHDGSMTTIHSNSPREAIARLETLVLMAGMELPVDAIRQQIAGAVDLIVQISRLGDGSRKIMSVTEVVGIQEDKVTLMEIFRFKETGFDKNRKIVGEFQAMGMVPTFLESFKQRGVNVPPTLFSKAQASTPVPVKKASGGNS